GSVLYERAKRRWRSMSAKVLVTGGAGYLGSVLTPALLAAGYRVTVLDNLLFRQTGLLDCCLHDGFSVIRGDCRDKGTLRQALRDADVVIPLAAIVGAPACKADQSAATTTNLEAVKLLLSLRSKSQRVIYPTTN